MKTLEKGQDKIKKICSMLRDETLEPAQHEAQEIIKAAEKEAERIIADAQKEAASLHKAAKVAIEQEHSVFKASLLQAGKQGVEALKQSIENKFFSSHLSALIEKNTADPELIAKLVTAIAKALEKDGLAADLTALVPKTVTPRQVNELILQDVLKELKDQTVVIGDFGGGVKVRLANKNLTIDMSESALKELLATYLVRKDFRKMIFEVNSSKDA